jgi:hypothetical protein
VDRTNEPDDETKLRKTDVGAEITRRRSKTGIDSPAMPPDEPTRRRGPTTSAGVLDPMAMLGVDQTRARDSAQSPYPVVARGAPLDPGVCIRHRYVLERLIGSGGMGQVWKAKDLRKEQAHDPNLFVAIKLLNSDFEADPDAFVSLQRESTKAQELAHPNVITVFDFDMDDDGSGRAFMSMELLEGETLDAPIGRHPAGMTRVEALPLIIGMAKGLEYAHKKGIVHSDLKPGNVFVTESGVPKVLDFGIARAAEAIGVERKEDSFDAGTLGGLTLKYASPEMIERLEPHFADDVYALGLIAYQLLTGRYPFRQGKATDARDDGARPARIRTIRRYEWRAIARALEFDRSKRWQNAGEFLRAYEGKSAAAMLAGAAAICLAVAAGGFWYQAYSASQPSVPFESLAADVQAEFRLHMANAEGEWRLVQQGNGDESLNAASEYGKAYALHPRNPDATVGLKKSADYILGRLNRIDDRADRLQKLKKMQDISDYYASYNPVVTAIRESGGGK